MFTAENSSESSSLQLSTVNKEINSKADSILQYFIYGFFVFGLIISPIYETYALALTMGAPCLILYLILKLSFPNSDLLRYSTPVLFCIQASQLIYQMHGLFEMNFFFFIIVAMMLIH